MLFFDNCSADNLKFMNIVFDKNLNDFETCKKFCFF
jgi:hypothetical protein